MPSCIAAHRAEVVHLRRREFSRAVNASKPGDICSSSSTPCAGLSRPIYCAMLSALRLQRLMHSPQVKAFLLVDMQRFAPGDCAVRATDLAQAAERAPLHVHRWGGLSALRRAALRHPANGQSPNLINRLVAVLCRGKYRVPLQSFRRPWGRAGWPPCKPAPRKRPP